MAEKPELMLILHNISPSSRQEETGIEVSVSQKHSQTSSKYGKTSNQQNPDKTHSPNEQGQTVQGHTLSSHICNSNQEIDRSKNTSNPSNVQTENSQVNRSSRVTQSTAQRRIDGPSYSCSLFNQRALQQQSHRHGQNPKTNIVHSRKCHIRSSDHYWYQPIWIGRPFRAFPP